MSDERLLSNDGVRKLWWSMDDTSGVATIRHEEDPTSVLDFNRDQLSAESGNWKGDMHHIARIPQVLYLQWWAEFGGNPMSKENRPRLMRKLNDRDFNKARVKSGRV